MQVNWKSIELEGVHAWDYPDMVDVYASYAEHVDGTPLTDDELEEFTDKYAGDLQEMACLQVCGG